MCKGTYHFLFLFSSFLLYIFPLYNVFDSKLTFFDSNLTVFSQLLKDLVTETATALANKI